MSKERIALWDNAKWLMLMFVVLGHLLEGIRPEDPTAYWLYTFIYLFHMPVMMFVSGYFSRAEMSKKTAYSVVQLLATYVIWEILIGGLRYLLTGWTPNERFLTSPSWSMWFLLSLASLKVLLPFMMQLRWPLTVAVIASLASGAFLDIDETFSLSRTLGFLPFFVGGYMVKERGLLMRAWFERPSLRLKVAAAAVLAVCGAAIAVLLRQSDSSALYRWAFHRDNYWQTTLNSEVRIELLPVDEIEDSTALVILNGALVTALFIALAVILGFAVLVLVPRSYSALTHMGQNTLYIYLLHIPVVRIVRHYEIIPDLYGNLGTLGVAVISISAVILAAILGSKFIKKPFQYVVEPNVAPLIRN